MKRIPTVKAIMTPFPHAVDATESVATATAMMEEHGIRHLPVIKDGKLTGVLSERDAFLAADMLKRSHEKLDEPVWGVCTREVYAVDLDERMDHVADEMANRHIGSAVVTRKGKLAGIVTTTDICRAYAELLREPFAPVDGNGAA